MPCFNIRFYDDSTCNDVLETAGFVNGICIATDTDQSYQFQWPYIYMYNGSAVCAGESVSYNAQDFPVCFYDAYDNDDYTKNDSYLAFSNIVSSSSDALSEGAVAGIVIGSLVAISIAGAAGYYLGSRGSGKPMASADQANNRL
jgi:hypothetical protein